MQEPRNPRNNELLPKDSATTLGPEAEALMEIGRRCASLADQDTRSPEDIIGFDENGIPSE